MLKGSSFSGDRTPVSSRLTLNSFLARLRIPEGLALLVRELAEVCKAIRNGLDSVVGRNVAAAVGSCNAFGDVVSLGDQLADEIVIKRLTDSALVKEIATEECPDVIRPPSSRSEYSVAADSLDGSSGLMGNMAVASIFSIQHGGLLGRRRLRNALAGAVCCVYGPGTSLLLTLRTGVHAFALSQDGSFVLIAERLSLDSMGRIYSAGGLRNEWSPWHRSFIESLEEKGYKNRYSGCLGADVQNILFSRGGIFAYPTSAITNANKLRLSFESSALSLIIEEAGGVAINGAGQQILDIAPDSTKLRTALYLGSKDEVMKARELALAALRFSSRKLQLAENFDD